MIVEEVCDLAVKALVLEDKKQGILYQYLSYFNFNFNI
jgi:hypothetical protein